MSTWAYDQIADIYDEDMGRRHALDDVVCILGSLPSPSARILDVGCGTGRIGTMLIDRGYDVVEVDRSLPIVRTLRSTIKSRSPLVMDGRRLGFASHTFDAVVFGFCGFQYLTTNREVLAFLHGVRHCLRPNGRLIIDVFIHRPDAVSGAFTLDYDRKMASGDRLRRWKRVVAVTSQVNRIERRYRLNNENEFATISEQRWYREGELEMLLEEGGFSTNRVVADYGKGASQNVRFLLYEASIRPAEAP